MVESWKRQWVQGQNGASEKEALCCDKIGLTQPVCNDEMPELEFGMEDAAERRWKMDRSKDWRTGP